MGKVAAVGTRMWVDSFDLSGFINSFEHAVGQEAIKVECFGDDGPRRVVGNYDHNTKYAGLFDGDDASFDQAVFALLGDGSQHIYSLMPGSAVEGALGARLYVAKLTDQPRKGSGGAAVMLDLNTEGNGELARGVVLANASISATGNRTGRNMVATTLGQTLAVHFHLLAFNGTNITLKVQESSDNGGSDAYADVSGLTSGALTAKGAVRATTTAATEAYKRVAITGTFTTATIGVVAGLVAGA